VGTSLGLEFSFCAPPSHWCVTDHQALTTARQILTVLGIDLDQVRPEPRSLRDILDAYTADLATRATPTHCANVRARLWWLIDDLGVTHYRRGRRTGRPAWGHRARLDEDRRDHVAPGAGRPRRHGRGAAASGSMTNVSQHARRHADSFRTKRPVDEVRMRELVQNPGQPYRGRSPLHTAQQG
jgi:hypothetical protein